MFLDPGFIPAPLLMLLCRYFYATLALLDTKAIAALISIPLPHAFTSVLPALLAASLALVILQAVLLWALYAWRTLQQYKADVKADADMSARTLTQKKPLAVCSGVLAVLQYGVVMWFVFMLAISMLWYGGGMVAAKATMDGVSTMSVVDETLPRLIENAMGIDPRKQVRASRLYMQDRGCVGSWCTQLRT